MSGPDDAALRRELESQVARSLDRHLSMAKEWLPHEWVPWSRGRDFAGEEGLRWEPEQSAIGDGVRAALVLNLLTEDNLPSYHYELMRLLGGGGPWEAWVRRWTAEEARHATSLRDYLMLSRSVDPDALERQRMTTVQTGWSAGGRGLLRSLAYASFQELATRIAHRNTGVATGDPFARRLLARIAADEHLHMVFYRELVGAALAVAPSQMLVALAEEVRNFAMPGAELPGFARLSVAIADAGIYDVRMHRDQVIAPMLEHWNIFELPCDDAVGEEAKKALRDELDRLETIAARYEERRRRRSRRVGP